MQVGVDEAGDDDLAGDVDLPRAAIVPHRPDDAVVADRDVALDEFAADEIETRPPFSTRSASARPRPCTIARERKAMASVMKWPRGVVCRRSLACPVYNATVGQLQNYSECVQKLSQSI